MFQCKKCGSKFPTERGLHAHLKAHGMTVADYYCEFYPRKDLLTRQAIQFKQKDEYFSTYFSNRENMLEWLSASPENEAKDLALDMLKKRAEIKKLKFAPSEVELFFADLPPIKEYKRLFGSYTKACELADLTPPFKDKLPVEWSNDFSKKKILIDSREQRGLRFANSECHKLDIGDYSTVGADYTNTAVDRKSFEDWCGTLVGDNLERFRREINRAKTQDCYLWVVIECPMDKVYVLKKTSHHKPNLSFIAHNMRILVEEFRGHLQFVFSGSRENSQLIIPKLLCLGDKLYNVDMQYFLGGQN